MADEKPVYKPGTKGVKPADNKDPVDVTPSEAWELYKRLPNHEGVQSLVQFYKVRNRKISHRTLVKWCERYDWVSMRKVWRETAIDPGHLPAGMMALANWADTFEPTVALKGVQALIVATLMRKLPDVQDAKYLQGLADLYEKMENLKLQVFQYQLAKEEAAKAEPTKGNGAEQPIKLADWKK